MKVDNDFAHLIVADLLKNGLIPQEANFAITEDHLSAYTKLYSIYKSNNLNVKTNTKSNYRLARKLAGLTLIKWKLERGLKANQCKEGFVYTVANPAWPEYLKLGMSVDTKKRIASYQTYSPFRDYRLTNYEFVFNRREAERLALKQFNQSLESGEWLQSTDANLIMNYIRNIGV